MSNYTDVECGNRHVAETVKAYLESELASIEEIERPNITAIIEKSTLRVTYHADDCHRGDWDMQLLGYRDGLETALPPPRAESQKSEWVDDYRRSKASNVFTNGYMTQEQLDRAELIAESRGIDLETAQELVYLRDAQFTKSAEGGNNPERGLDSPASSPESVSGLARQAAEWQPIETAPKSNWLLFFTPEMNELGYLAFQAVGYIDRHGEITGVYQWEDGLEPTHWMLLPTAPALAGSRDEGEQNSESVRDGKDLSA